MRSERPLLRHSWTFTLFLGLLATFAWTGIGLMAVGRTDLQLWHFSVATWHEVIAAPATLVFVVLAVSHVRSLYGPVRASLLLLVLFGSLALMLELATNRRIQVVYWWDFWLLPVLVFVVLWGLLRRPRARADARAAASGALTASLFWSFFVFANLQYLTAEHHQFPIDYFPYLHVAEAVAACAALGFHLWRAGTRAVPRGVPLRQRAAFHAVLAIIAVAWISGQAWRAGRFLTPVTGEQSVRFPVEYDTSKVAVGKPLGPDPRQLFSDSKGCDGKGCHAETYRQWSISSHRYAGVLQTYRRSVEVAYQELGPEATLLCAKCHTPVMAMLGIPDDPKDDSLDELRRAGIPCLFCHAVDHVGETRGNGDFVLRVERPHFFGYRPIAAAGGALKNEYIWRSLQAHRLSMVSLDDTARSGPTHSEYCVGCHRLDMSHVGFGESDLVLSDLQTPYDNSNTHATGIACWHCHLQLAKYGNEVDHARPDHRMLGTNNAMSLLVPRAQSDTPDIGELDRATRSFLRGDYAIPDYERVFLARLGHKLGTAYERYLHDNPKIVVALRAPERAALGSTVPIEVEVRNRTGAHPIPSGPVNYSEYWIEVVAEGPDGQAFYQSGVLDETHRLPAGTVRFGGQWFDRDGNPVEKYRFWAKRELRDRRSVPVDGATTVGYQLPLPAKLAGTITVRAAFCYRRVNQDFADWAYDHDGTTFPVYRFDNAEARIAVIAPDDGKK